MRPGLLHPDDASAVLPEALVALTELREREVTHRWVRSVRSSQAFALNLFAPLTDAGVAQVIAGMGHPVAEVESIIFEYEDESDCLAEASRRSPHRTQVDVLLRATTVTGQRVGVLIEVKLTESDFGSCSAFQSPDNPSRATCGQPGLFGGDPNSCFQLQNHGYGHRRYAEALVDIPLTLPEPDAACGGCWLRRGNSQPMRNLALAHLLVGDGEFDRAIYALCAPSAHPTIWRRFSEFRALFGDTDRVATCALTAETVARAHVDGGTALRDRHGAAVGFDSCTEA
jgi:hypothetical protein